MKKLEEGKTFPKRSKITHFLEYSSKEELQWKINGWMEG